MAAIGFFPFGEQVNDVVQTDRSPKKVFVLGVYASAVHARWIDADGKALVRALAVASEPTIFWRGEGAQEIIERIKVSPGAGRLLAADETFNGPSGKALDDFYLEPLGLERKDTWLCDLVPHSCVNPKQAVALKREYEPRIEKHGLPRYSVPTLPVPLADDARREAIRAELVESKASILILLGDLPIRWFLRSYDQRWSRLSDFGLDAATYGRLHDVTIAGKAIKVLPLCHPRQAGRLGASTQDWHNLHAEWVAGYAKEMRRLIR